MPFSMLEEGTGVCDMCLLEPLTEENFIENLKIRFSKNHIYTYIGNVVVSMNPYKPLEIYDKKVIYDYRGKNIYEMPPHVYAIADGAYRSMRDHGLNQCVLICGESGSGKTEASKTILQYVAEVSGKGREIDRVKERLLQSNPILEAFGNAKTNKNDNSSRFGKYMDVEFDFKGDPLGGVITSYLLEKSRLVLQSAGERSFHIFYQLLSSKDSELLDHLHLRPDANTYAYLRKSACVCVEGINDNEAFSLTKKAMDVVGFSNEDVKFIFQMLSVILLIGNFKFSTTSSKSGMDGCDLEVEKEDLEAVADLIGCGQEAIREALTKRTVLTNNESVQTELTCSEASYARDALCKTLYGRLLDWIIQLINETIKVSCKGVMKSLGVLDIYGFEIFEHNSFEQFIINYCNEKLQQVFIDLTLKEEQQEYVSEGIEWIHVDYFNNSIICELIEKNNTGILSLLDEECLMPGDTSDTSFLTKLTDVCGDHAHFESRGVKKLDRSLEEDQFRLVHYAGSVTYNVTGFLDKNSDLLYRDLSRMMHAGKHPQLQTLFPDGDPHLINLKRPATAGYQFKVSVAELMRNLLVKSPNYIRCIKPNHNKRPAHFVDSLVTHQVRYLGLMENVRVRRAGYAYRQTYEVFLFRYKMLNDQTWPQWRGGSTHDGVKHLMHSLSFHQEEYALGRTKIFIRNPVTLFSLEGRRRDHLNNIATLISSKYRSWISRKKFLNMKASQVRISSIYRGYQERMRYSRLKIATLVLCSYARGWKTRKLAALLREERKRNQAADVINKYFRGWKVRKQHRHRFRAVAGPKIFQFLKKSMTYKYLLNLKDNLPSECPLDDGWHVIGGVVSKEVQENLRNLYHRNRCLKYRLGCSGEMRNIMQVKLKASEIFRDKKSSYPKSVGVLFKGDHLGMLQNEKWTKCNHDNIVFSDNILKINRKDGKSVPHIAALTDNSLLICDSKTLKNKSNNPLQHITSIHLSFYLDPVAVFTLEQTEQSGKKGDLVVACSHIVELVSMVTIISDRTLNHLIPVSFAKNIKTTMYGGVMEICFIGSDKINEEKNNCKSNNNNDHSILNGTQILKKNDTIEIINVAE